MSDKGLSAAPMWIGGAALVAAVAAGGAFWAAQQPAAPGEAQAITPAVQPAEQAQVTAPAEDAPQVAAVAPDTPAPTEAEPAAPQIADAPEVPQAGTSAALPRLDEVRLDQGGIAVIAGRASPFAEVVLRVDGGEVARATSDGRGAFATVAVLSPSEIARVLTLAEIDPDGAERAAEEELILAPVRAATPAPQVALAAPAPAQPAAPAAPAADAAVSTPATPSPSDVSPTVPANAVTAPQAPATPDQSLTALPQEEAAAPQVATTPAQPLQEVAILRSGPEGVTVEPPRRAAAPDVQDQIELDSISYSAAGEVAFSGRAQSTTREVRVYLDNRPVAALQVAPSGDWRGEIPDVDTGIYTLRLDEVAADGRVTSRVETPFKREAPEDLAAAVEAAEDAPVTAITVQAGATLWAIARERYGDGKLYVQVFDANRETIRDPDLIYPGQVFALPD